MAALKSEIISGTSPIRLNAKGRDQAHLLAHHIATHGGADMIVSSDLPRAMDTAKILQEHTKAPVIATSGLHPWHLGEIEGHPEKAAEDVVQTAARHTPDQALKGKSAESGVAGESFNAFKNRLTEHVASLRELAKKHPHSRIIGVTHSRSLHLVRAHGKAGGGSKEPDLNEFFRSDPPKDHLFQDTGTDLQPYSEQGHLGPGLYLVRHTATNDDNA